MGQERKRNNNGGSKSMMIMTCRYHRDPRMRMMNVWVKKKKDINQIWNGLKGIHANISHTLFSYIYTTIYEKLTCLWVVIWKRSACSVSPNFRFIYQNHLPTIFNFCTARLAHIRSCIMSVYGGLYFSYNCFFFWVKFLTTVSITPFDLGKKFRHVF